MIHLTTKIKVLRDKDGNVDIPQEDIDALKAHVAFICVEKGHKYYPVGTAFLLSITESNGYIFNYWITCKHVVKEYLDNKIDLFLRLNKPNNTVSYVPLQDEWVYHPDKNVDLAVLYWLHDEAMSAYEVQAMEAASLYIHPGLEPMYKSYVKEGHDVMLLGLFPKYYGDKRNLPMFRFGKVSLLTTEKTSGYYGDTDQYFIECDVWKGSSGSPVYVSIPHPIPSHLRPPNVPFPDEYLNFYGVASAFYPHRASVSQRAKKNDNEPKINEIITHYGISLVTPSDKVVEVLYGEIMKNKRKKKVDKEKDKPEPASIDVDSSEPENDVLIKEKFEKVLRKNARPLKKGEPKKK